MRTVDVLRKRGINLSDPEFAALLDDAIEEASGAGDDPVGTLTPGESAALTAGGADLQPRRADEPAPRGEATATYGALLAGSGTVAEVASRLGIDASRVRHRLAERSLYGIRLRSGWRLPAFQFRGPEVVPGLDAVLPALPDNLHPVALWRWLTAPLADLADRADPARGGGPVSPLDWLAGGGDPASVAALAADL